MCFGMELILKCEIANTSISEMGKDGILLMQTNILFIIYLVQDTTNFCQIHLRSLVKKMNYDSILTWSVRR